MTTKVSTVGKANPVLEVDTGQVTEGMRILFFADASSVHTRRWVAAVAERGAAATRQLAKRQITWLRSMPWRHAIACDITSADEALEQTLALIQP